MCSDDQIRQEEFRRKQEQERIIPLAGILLSKLEVHMKGRVMDFKKAADAECVELVEGPGGGELLHRVGYVYEQEARQALGGLGGFWAKVKAGGHTVSETMSIINAASKAQAASERMEKEREQGKLGEVSQAEREAYIAGQTMVAIWKVGKMEIEGVIRQVCAKILNAPGLTKYQKTSRANALSMLGEIYMKEGRAAQNLERQQWSQRTGKAWPPGA
tara:strand:+ start:310 stop:960 length:651 start_codon:yes stop_codon:yes gene_type:complete